MHGFFGVRETGSTAKLVELLVESLRRFSAATLSQVRGVRVLWQTRPPDPPPETSSEEHQSLWSAPLLAAPEQCPGCHDQVSLADHSQTVFPSRPMGPALATCDRPPRSGANCPHTRQLCASTNDSANSSWTLLNQRFAIVAAHDQNQPC